MVIIIFYMILILYKKLIDVYFKYNYEIQK
jgi:hypothetical protein